MGLAVGSCLTSKMPNVIERRAMWLRATRSYSGEVSGILHVCLLVLQQIETIAVPQYFFQRQYAIL